ncbi:TonB-dependent receptor domain-containing protein [Zobellia laminariae]|uniref:TonB-dependent receptor domain-containing protein n=1 Tax=Zobellia laminariae TaxID=248906 RepID=UPI0026F44A4D|nr:TonB-dependent receptor [Zobellia laminariae]WKX76761.1 TonB-dependent receptor [Zobellia laminariae]
MVLPVTRKYLHTEHYLFLGNYAYVVNNSVVNGIGIDRLANPDLKWEKTNQVDAGIEVGLFDGRISFEVDLYRKLTEDMLLNSPVPTSSGYASVFRNIGSMENKGIEFSLSTIILQPIIFLGIRISTLP